MDVFPQSLSTKVLRIAHPKKVDGFEHLARQGRVQAFVSYMEHENYRIFHHFYDDDWIYRKTCLENFKRVCKESKECHPFDPKALQWDKVAKRLQQNPDRRMKNSDIRLGFKVNNVFLVKHGFTFGQWQVRPGEAHLYQTSHVPLVFFKLPSKSINSASNPSLVRRSLAPFDQMVYDLYVFRPHSVYVVPEDTRYVIMTVQKTMFAVDVIKASSLKHWSEQFDIRDCTSHRSYKQSVYNVPPPTPLHRPASPPRRQRSPSPPKPPVLKRRLPTPPLFSEPSPKKRKLIRPYQKPDPVIDDDQEKSLFPEAHPDELPSPPDGPVPVVAEDDDEEEDTLHVPPSSSQLVNLQPVEPAFLPPAQPYPVWETVYPNERSQEPALSNLPMETFPESTFPSEGFPEPLPEPSFPSETLPEMLPESSFPPEALPEPLPEPSLSFKDFPQTFPEWSLPQEPFPVQAPPPSFQTVTTDPRQHELPSCQPTPAMYPDPGPFNLEPSDNNPDAFWADASAEEIEKFLMDFETELAEKCNPTKPLDLTTTQNRDTSVPKVRRLVWTPVTALDLSMKRTITV